MRRTPVISALLVLAAAAPAAAQGDPPPLRAALAACETGAEPAQRFAVFTGSMPARRGTARMAIRFDLRERRAGDRWRRVRPPKWSRWERSRPGRAGFIYTKRVERLHAGASYRAVLRFRWYDDAGDVQRTAVRRTPVCEQPDQRPNLVAESLLYVGPTALGGRYRLTVANTGRAPAGRSIAGVVVGYGEEMTREVPRLAPGERVTVDVDGPRCDPGETVTARVDVRDDVDEASERDNRFALLCPAR